MTEIKIFLFGMVAGSMACWIAATLAHRKNAAQVRRLRDFLEAMRAAREACHRAALDGNAEAAEEHAAEFRALSAEFDMEIKQHR